MTVLIFQTDAKATCYEFSSRRNFRAKTNFFSITIHLNFLLSFFKKSCWFRSINNFFTLVYYKIYKSVELVFIFIDGNSEPGVMCLSKLLTSIELASVTCFPVSIRRKDFNGFKNGCKFLTMKLALIIKYFSFLWSYLLLFFIYLFPMKHGHDPGIG